MRLNQTILHLLLEALESSSLSLVDTLIGGFHLSWTKLSNGLSVVIGIIDSLVDILQIGLSCESGGALDPLWGPQGTLLRWSRQSLTIVIISLERAHVVSKHDLLLLYQLFLVSVFVLESGSGWNWIQNWFVQASELARYLAAWWSCKNLRLIQTLNRVLGFDWGEIKRLFDAWIVSLVLQVLVSPKLVSIILPIWSSLYTLFHIWIATPGNGTSRPGTHRISRDWLPAHTKLSWVLIRKLIHLLVNLLEGLLLRWKPWSWAFISAFVHAQAWVGLWLGSWATSKGFPRFCRSHHLPVVLVAVVVLHA